MKLRNKLLSLALVATVAATNIAPMFARQQAPTKHDHPIGLSDADRMAFSLLLVPASFGCWYVISGCAQAVVKKVKGVQELTTDDGYCGMFAFLSTLAIAGFALSKLGEYGNNGGYSSK